MVIVHLDLHTPAREPRDSDTPGVAPAGVPAERARAWIAALGGQSQIGGRLHAAPAARLPPHSSRRRRAATGQRAVLIGPAAPAAAAVLQRALTEGADAGATAG